MLSFKKEPPLSESDRKRPQGLVPLSHLDRAALPLAQANAGSCAQVWFLQQRFHKDILLNPVLVLNFCPDLSSKPGHLNAATRELLFLLDGSGAGHKACGAQCGYPRHGSRGWQQLR